MSSGIRYVRRYAPSDRQELDGGPHVDRPGGRDEQVEAIDCKRIDGDRRASFGSPVIRPECRLWS